MNRCMGNFDIGGYGAFLRNNYATTPQAVTMTGTNIFDSDWAGLYISSVGAITANQITASEAQAVMMALILVTKLPLRRSR